MIRHTKNSGWLFCLSPSAQKRNNDDTSHTLRSLHVRIGRESLFIITWKIKNPDTLIIKDRKIDFKNIKNIENMISKAEDSLNDKKYAWKNKYIRDVCMKVLEDFQHQWAIDVCNGQTNSVQVKRVVCVVATYNFWMQI